MLQPAQAISRQFNLTPNPRILRMLGEISLLQWRCIAELIDNSVDAFMDAARAGSPVANTEVHVSLPSTMSDGGRITIVDTALGMTPEVLETAVTAGWTSHEPGASLGMFGMGFNIATARLGTVTTVWTTRDGDPEWYGLTIDFDALTQQKHFNTPLLTRPKLDAHEHGTEVTIERLKPEQRQWFAKAGNRSRVIDELAKAYSSMVRLQGVPISFRLSVNGTAVKSRQHCIWGTETEPRIVKTGRMGDVESYQSVNVQLGTRGFCTKCWEWLSASEKECIACGSVERVVMRERTVRGWLGLQRYLSETEYGVDFVRHGRKIELGNKELFSWSRDGVTELEYPIDDPRQRGRIVGEIHLDHCRVNYTKDKFDRTDPAWEEMVQAVRGRGPLRPEVAAQSGFPPNVSPLSKLYQAFRRSNPKNKDMAGGYSRLLVVKDNDRAEEMAEKFHDGEPEYQSDEKWWNLIEELEKQLLKKTSGSDAGETSSVADWPNPAGQPAQDAATAQPDVAPAPVRAPIPSLTREYRDDVTELKWEVAAFAVGATDPELAGDMPWRLKANNAGIHQFFVNFEHDVFKSATMTPLDGLLAHLTWAAMDFTRGRNLQADYGRILASLRARYAGTSKLDVNELAAEAGQTLASIGRALVGQVSPEDGTALFAELVSAEKEAVLKRMAVRGVTNPQKEVSDGRFLEYATRKTFLEFFSRHPEFFFDGRYWDTPYTTLDFGVASATEEAQSQRMRYYSSLLADAVWLADQDQSDLSQASRARLLRAALALELLAAGMSVEGEN
jgi:hypothetical protein